MAEEQEVAAIPVVEERLEVTKRQIETGRVRVHVTVDEREEIVPAKLARDDVEVERIPRNVAVAELPAVRLEGNVTIIPVVEEQLVVEKRLVLVEEIHIHRKTTTLLEGVPVTLRSERAEVERSEGERAARAEPAAAQ